MSETSSPTGDAIATVLGGLGRRIRDEQTESDSYQAMASSETVGQVIRRVELTAGRAVLDAFRVLHEKFGLQETHELYDLLHQVPARYRLYRKAFEAETYVGCVDRTVARLADELRAAGGDPDRPVAPGTDRRVAAAAVTVDASTAADVLALADQADNARRIQRLSSDAREITRRIQAALPELPEAALPTTVRLVLGAAADIAHEQDGITDATAVTDTPIAEAINDSANEHQTPSTLTTFEGVEAMPAGAAVQGADGQVALQIGRGLWAMSCGEFTSEELISSLSLPLTVLHDPDAAK